MGFKWLDCIFLEEPVVHSCDGKGETVKLSHRSKWLIDGWLGGYLADWLGFDRFRVGRAGLALVVLVGLVLIVLVRSK